MTTTGERFTAVTPADWMPGPPQGSWTYEDYAAIPYDGNRYEIVNGVLIMTPAPTPEHQDIVGEIYSALRTRIKLTKLGRVFSGPVDVLLESKNVFQPDVVVVLNEHLERIQAKKIVGAPDLVVEIASYSTAAIDRLIKFEKYAHAVIPEYWIVRPERHTGEVFVLEDGAYHSRGIFSGQATLPSRIAPDLPVYVEQFFL